MRVTSRAVAIEGALAALAAGAALAGADTLSSVASVPVLAAGFGLPFLVRLSPGEPSALKLGLLSLLASPFAAGAAWIAFRTGLPPDRARIALLASGALLALVGLRAHPVRRDPLGRAAWSALALAAASAALLAFVFRDASSRVAHQGPGALLRAMAVGRSVPPEDPFVAGLAARGPWLVGATADLVRHVLAAGPSAALAGVVITTTAAATAAVYLLFAPLWRDGRALVLAVALAALGVFHPGFLELATKEPSRAIAASLGVGSWAAGAHALRHGTRPWPLLTGAFAAAAILAEPTVGAGSAACLAAAALLSPPAARPRVLLGLAAPAVPALVLARVLGAAALPEPTALGPAGAPALLLAAAGLLAPAARQAWSSPTRRPLLALCAAGLVLGPADVAAAGLVAAWLARAPAAPGLGAKLLAKAVLAGTASCLAWTGPRRWSAFAYPRSPLPLEERGGHCELLATSKAARDLGRLLAWMARELPFRERDPVLWIRPGSLPFAEPYADLDERHLALLADLPLESSAAERNGDADRADLLARVFRTRHELPRELLARADARGRPVLLLVTPIDRRAQPWLLQKPGPWGFRVVRVEGGSVLFVHPAELADTVPPEQRVFPDDLVGPDRPRVFGAPPDQL